MYVLTILPLTVCCHYFRFLPDGAYLNAREHTPETLAVKMNHIAKNDQDYYGYFKFHRYYTYHTKGESEDIDPLCTFCKFINGDSIWKGRRVFPQFSRWWNHDEPISEMADNSRNYTMSV